MEFLSQKREFWWLVALDASLFLSENYWGLTAIHGRPNEYPWRFTLVVAASAAVAMLAAHVGPAVAARRGLRMPLAVSIWLGAGCLAWLFHMAAWMAGGILFVGILFLAGSILAGLAGGWWKPVTAIGLAGGVSLLGWAFGSSVGGLWVRNLSFADGPGAPNDWLVAKGILLTVAPAFVIADRMGRGGQNNRHIWLSGVFGIWVPAVVPAALFSLAVRGGMNRHWVPSLPPGMIWGLQETWPPLASPWLFLSLLGQAMLSMVGLRLLAPHGTWKGTLAWLVPVAGLAGLIAAAGPGRLWWTGGSQAPEMSPAGEVWAWSLLGLGAAWGAFAAWRPPNLTLPRPPR